jgi:hypothetical protein
VEIGRSEAEYGQESEEVKKLEKELGKEKGEFEGRQRAEKNSEELEKEGAGELRNDTENDARGASSGCHCDCGHKRTGEEHKECPCCKKFVELTLEMPMSCEDFSLKVQNKFKCAIAEVRLCIVLLSKIVKRVNSVGALDEVQLDIARI